MPHCFISYSSEDLKLADFIFRELEKHNVEVFMASASLTAGQRWSPTILENLKNSKVVVVLASKASVASAFVNQEIGIALGAAKDLIPIVWDMPADQLPGWLREYQALDLRNASLPELQRRLALVTGNKEDDGDEWIGVLVAFIALLGVIALGFAGGFDVVAKAFFGKGRT